MYIWTYIWILWISYDTIWLKLEINLARYCQSTSVNGKTLNYSYKNEIIGVREMNRVRKAKCPIQKNTKWQSVCLASQNMFEHKLSNDCQYIDSEWFSICPQLQNVCLLRNIGLLILVNSYYTPEKILWSSLNLLIIYLSLHMIEHSDGQRYQFESSYDR